MTYKIYKISGGRPLRGKVTVGGAKNAALPILAASLLTDEKITLSNVPNISDVEHLLQCLSATGKLVNRVGDNTLEFPPSICKFSAIPAVHARPIRGSIVLLGPLLARHEKVILPLPGGCNIGKRPIDQHIMAMQALGVEIIEYEDRLECTRKQARLQANVINFAMKTVTGTENAIMAAVLADGTSILTNVAQEPEVIDLIRFLNSIGAKIHWIDADTLEIIGVEHLGACDNHMIIGDRIEAGTYLVAAAITKGAITVKGVAPVYLQSCLDVLQAIGATIRCKDEEIYLNMEDREPLPFAISTQPYPGFPTDLQSLFLSLATQLNGNSIIVETVFDNRFQAVSKLKTMGAIIKVDDNKALIQGKTALTRSIVRATDLRSGAALICAALAAEGETVILDAHHILRGYEKLADKLRQLGATIDLVDVRMPACSKDKHQGVFFPSGNKAASRHREVINRCELKSVGTFHL